MSIVIFVCASLVLAALCRRQLVNPRCHGFYRFFAIEALLALACINLAKPPQLFGVLGIASGVFASGSAILVLSALAHLRRARHSARTACPENFAFENTSELITDGLYQYIRHPMYSSLLLLGIGLSLQKPDLWSGLLLALVILFCWLTARTEEVENFAFFGAEYRAYQKRSHMLIPYVL